MFSDTLSKKRGEEGASCCPTISQKTVPRTKVHPRDMAAVGWKLLSDVQYSLGYVLRGALSSGFLRAEKGRRKKDVFLHSREKIPPETESTSVF